METALPAIRPGRGRVKATEVHDSVQLFRGPIAFLSGLTFLIAVAALCGWAIGNQTLMTVIPGHASMKVNTAICFLALAVGLAASRYSHGLARWVMRGAGLSVVLLGGLTLMEFLTGMNFHLDEALFHDPVQLIYPGRMSEISATNFCLGGLSLLLLTGGWWARRVGEGLALVVTSVSFAAMIGFVYGVPLLYGATGYLGYMAMAFHTGVAFLLVGMGLLLAAEDSVLGGLLSAQERGSWLFRRMLPVAVALPAVLGWVYLRPPMTFGRPVLGIALFAGTMSVAGVLGVWLMANLVNREERQIAMLDRVREESAAAVRQSEQELRLITDHLPTLLSYVDADGRYVRVNRTYELWLGRPAETIVGRTIRELLGEAYWARTAAPREAALRGETVTFETIYPTVQGDRETQVTYAPDLDDQGRMRGMACLALDMYDRRKAEVALRQSEKLAAVGRLASSIAHEMNNPLEAVTNLLYLAGQDAQGEVGEYVEQAQQELARVTHIVTQTLRFHRQSTRPVRIRVSELVGQVLALYQGKLMQGEIKVALRFRDDAGLLCRDGEVRQALANLIGNAADAMKGGGRLLVRTAGAVDGWTLARGVWVTVADTGHGIPAATRRTLFEPFHTTKGETGSGLGLWISKEIVERHGGRMRVRSSTRAGSSGTVFRVFIAEVGTENQTERGRLE